MPPKKVAKPAAPTAADFSTGDVVLTKLKGYPEWPGKIIDQASAPSNVLQQKGGKPILVRFYPDADYVWTYPRDLRQLTTKVIDAYLSDPSKKAGKLKEGYEIARDPATWDEEQSKRDQQAQQEADEAADDDVDMLAEDADGKPSKKRKRGGEEGVVEKTTKSKVKKEPAASKAKKEAPASKKRKTDEPTEKKAKAEKAGSAAKDKKDKSASASAAPAGDDDNSEEAKQVKGWRAHLQKAFLTKGVPTDEEMPKYDTIFTNMEKFEMQPQWLASSKLGKVLKKMAAITEEIPREAEYHIKERSNALMEKWKTMLGKEPASATAPAGEASGAAADDKADAAQEESKPEPAADAAPAAEPAVNGVNGGVNAEGQTNGTAEEEKKVEEPAKQEEPATDAVKAPETQANGTSEDATPAVTA